MVNRVITALVCSAFLVCGQAAAESGHEAGVGGVSRAAMDASVAPGNDFYSYANGGWERTTEIPADRSSIGAFYTAFLTTERQTRELVDAIVASSPAPGSDAERIKNYYLAFTNRDAIDAAGLAPVQGDLARFAAITNRRDLSRVLGEQVRADVDPLNATDFRTENLFGVFITQGLATPGDVIPYILQGGLGLPEREYYLSEDARMAGLREAYKAYVQQVFTLAGFDDAPARAQRVFDLEMDIARAHASREQSENMAGSATVWRRRELAHNAPGIDWGVFLRAAKLDRQEKFGAYHAGAITGLSALVRTAPLDAWKDCLAFHQISSHAAFLPAQFDQASFAFYGTTLSGTPQMRAREKRGLDAVNGALGDAVGKAYVEHYFPAAARAQVQSMVDAIKTAFARRVESLDWMAPETRSEALRKVETIVVGVGYPDSWRDYAHFAVSADNAYANAVNAGRAEYAHQLAKLGRPMDRGEWWMTPQTVNAVNLPVQNALNFPAAILQPPFFDAHADAAYNYGAIGAVIGHEISHSFDNNGAAFDATGALRNWWTEADLAAFKAQGEALARQYDAYEPLPGLTVNGTLTLGENIADVAGLQAAYEAYRASLGGAEAPVIEGMSGDQRFFLAFAQTWATKMREASLRARIATDGHAPGMYRAATVRNIDAWYPAFDVKEGEALFLAPDQRVRIW